MDNGGKKKSWDFNKVLEDFRNQTSNNTLETNFLNSNYGISGNFWQGDPNHGQPITGGDSTLMRGARGFVASSGNEGEEDVNDEIKDDKAEKNDSSTITSPDIKSSTDISTQKQRIDKFLGLGDPDRIAKRTEIKSARKENRATNRLRRAGETEYRDEDGEKTGEKIPTRKDARKDKKARIKAAKVKSDNKVVEKNKAK